MADESAPVTPTPAPAVQTPVSTPLATAPQEPVQTVPVEVVPQVPQTEITPQAASVEAVVEKSVLGEALEKAEAPKTPETAPVEAQTETPGPQDEGGQTEQAPPPKYDSFTFPEGIQVDATRVGEFTNLLAELETSGKATHEAVQAFGQKAVEFHVNEMKNTVEKLTDYYQKAWDKQKTDWKEAFLKDPDIGGNRFQTTIDSALTFIRTHGGNEDQQKEFRMLMDSSGLGNHPAVIRLLANAGQAMSEGRPLAAPRPISQPKSKTQTMYGSKS